MTIHEIPVGKGRFNIPVSRVKGAKNNKILGITSLTTIFEQIKNGTPEFKAISQRLRDLKKTDAIQYSNEKEANCQGFIIGEYSKRTDKNCLVYCPLIGFDIDGLSSEDLDIILSDISKSEYVFAAFPSPSYQGFRILIWCDSTPKTHKAVYQQVCDYLSKTLKLPTDKVLRVTKKKIKGVPHIDTGTNNISRLWFFSHVEESLFYLNVDSKVFVPIQNANQIERPKRPPKHQPLQSGVSVSPTVTVEQKIKHCLEKVNRQDIPAGRNNYVFSLASELCRHGVIMSTAINECLKYQEGDFKENEVRKAVNSAYKLKIFGEFSDQKILNYLSKGKSSNNEINKSEKKTSKKTKKGAAEGEQELNKFQKIERYVFNKYEFRKNIISIEIEFRNAN